MQVMTHMGRNRGQALTMGGTTKNEKRVTKVIEGLGSLHFL